MTSIEKYLEQYSNTTDSGRFGKAYELALREFFSGRTQKAVKSQGKVDATVTFTLDGKRKAVTVEIKTACGIIDTADKAQYIIYCPEIDTTTDASEQGGVFTRDEWNDFLNGYDGRGKLIKVDSQRGQAHIQSFYTESRPKASKPIANYIWGRVCEQPTPAEWIEELRG